MFREAIPGIEKLLRTEIPRGSCLLVTGIEGTLKSALVFHLASSYLKATKTNGLYATLEQTAESHISNMKSLRIRKAESLHIFDYQDIRMEWKERDPDLVRVTEEIVEFYKDKYPDLSIFCLDSLNVIYALSNPTNIRRDMYYFFAMLRDNGLTSFLIMETSPLTGSIYLDSQASRSEHFLADGVIDLGISLDKEGAKRYIQIKKMRGTEHSMEKHQIIAGMDGLSILGPIY
jgi:KaiC/GvpD/RAD55 family RecA-like ATPase